MLVDRRTKLREDSAACDELLRRLTPSPLGLRLASFTCSASTNSAHRLERRQSGTRRSGRSRAMPESSRRGRPSTVHHACPPAPRRNDRSVQGLRLVRPTKVEPLLARPASSLGSARSRLDRIRVCGQIPGTFAFAGDSRTSELVRDVPLGNGRNSHALVGCRTRIGMRDQSASLRPVHVTTIGSRRLRSTSRRTRSDARVGKDKGMKATPATNRLQQGVAALLVEAMLIPSACASARSASLFLGSWSGEHRRPLGLSGTWTCRSGQLPIPVRAVGRGGKNDG